MQLSVEQALADAAAFASFVTSTWLQRKELVWVSVGGSYPGALSAWFRELFATPYSRVADRSTFVLTTLFDWYPRYPSVVDVAISSSGVVAATKNFVEFDMQVSVNHKEKTGFKRQIEKLCSQASSSNLLRFAPVGQRGHRQRMCCSSAGRFPPKYCISNPIPVPKPQITPVQAVTAAFEHAWNDATLQPQVKSLRSQPKPPFTL